MKTHRVRTGTRALSVALIAVAYIFGRSFVANGAGGSSGLTSVIALQRPDGAPAEKAIGTVIIQQGTSSQEFAVDVRGIVPTDSTPVGGLGVFLSVDPFPSTNFYFVSTMDGSTNGHWTLDLNAGPGASPQLGVTDVTNLFEHIVIVADTTTNVYLESIIPPFASNPKGLGYKKKVKLTPPNDSPSPKAKGTVTVKLDGVHGASVFDVRAKKLAIGNGYWLVVHGTNDPPSDVPDTVNLVGHNIRFMGDTGKGQQLLDGALTNGVVRVDQLTGATVDIIDAFGVIHLTGIVP
ncbi:MAG TPA: hypothetical protein VLZ12_05355 [Verrucomicrobiae bacterium]|nr:hypothetical protein [Verrucomicrobiae bacterium]